MSLCPKCLRQEDKEIEMTKLGTALVCPKCKYSYDLPIRLRTHAELETENKELKEDIAKLRKLLKLSDETHQD